MAFRAENRKEFGSQLGDGILRKSGSLAAVLFLFNKGSDVVLENLQPSSGFSSQVIRLYIAKAFTLDSRASILKRTHREVLRSSRKSPNEEVPEDDR